MDVPLRFRNESMSNSLQRGPARAEPPTVPEMENSSPKSLQKQKSLALPVMKKGKTAELETGFGHLKAWKLQKARKGAHYAIFFKLDDENTQGLAQAVVDFLQGADLEVQLDRHATKQSGHWAFVISADEELLEKMAGHQNLPMRVNCDEAAKKMGLDPEDATIYHKYEHFSIRS